MDTFYSIIVYHNNCLWVPKWYLVHPNWPNIDGVIDEPYLVFNPVPYCPGHMSTTENCMDTFYSIIVYHNNCLWVPEWYLVHPNWPNIDGVLDEPYLVFDPELYCPSHMYTAENGMDTF
jgi:hypothetical protein